MLPWSVWVIVLVVAELTVRPSSAQDDQCPIDVLFVLDHSGSISDNDEGPIANWIYITDWVAEVVRATSRYPNVRYAAISYGTRAELEFNLDRYTDTLELVVAFRSIRNTGGNTNTTGALRLSRTAVWSSLANRPAAYDVLVLITDGMPSKRFEADGLLPEAERVKALGVRLIGIGVTTAVDEAVMRRIVSYPASQNYFGLSNFTQLYGILELLVSCIVPTPPSTTTPTTIPEPRPNTTTSTTSSTSTSTTSSTTTSTTTTTPASPTSTTTGSTTTTTSPTTTTTRSTSTSPTTTTTSSTSTSPTSTTTTSTTTTTTTPAPGPVECRHRADVVVVLDASGGRMDFSQFRDVRRFLVDMLTQLRAVVVSGALRVGMVRFADSAVFSFNLNTFSGDFPGLIDAVRTVGYIGGGTNTGIGTYGHVLIHG